MKEEQIREALRWLSDHEELWDNDLSNGRIIFHVNDADIPPVVKQYADMLEEAQNASIQEAQIINNFGI